MPRWPGQGAYAHRCTECRELFPAVMPHAELWSAACRAARSRRRRSGRSWPDTRTGRTCSECGDLFDAATYRGKVCGNPCKQRAIRRRRRERGRVTA